MFVNFASAPVATLVAQTGSLLYRGLAIRSRHDSFASSRLPVGDTAGCQPALHLPNEVRSIHLHRGDFQFPPAPQLAADVMASGTFVKKIRAFELRTARRAPARRRHRFDFQTRARRHRVSAQDLKRKPHRVRHDAAQRTHAQPQRQHMVRARRLHCVHRQPHRFFHDRDFVHRTLSKEQSHFMCRTAHRLLTIPAQRLASHVESAAKSGA